MTIDIENKEWPEDGKLPELVGKANPFAVPEGYFEGLEERIMAAVKLDELKSDIPHFTVPDGYFEQLSNNIQARIAVEEAVNNQDAGFTVPAGYFENLSDNIQSRIAVEQAMEAGETFEVPAGYFENLSSQIQSRVFVEEALIAEETFTVPDGYFEKLNAQILNKTVTQEAVQRKGSVIRLMRSTAFKYATAACLALIIGGGAFLREAQQPVTHVQTLLHKQVSNIPVDEIKDYLELNIDANDTRGLMDNDKQINTDALDADLQDYIDIN